MTEDEAPQRRAQDLETSIKTPYRNIGLVYNERLNIFFIGLLILMLLVLSVVWLLTLASYQRLGDFAWFDAKWYSFTITIIASTCSIGVVYFIFAWIVNDPGKKLDV